MHVTDGIQMDERANTGNEQGHRDGQLIGEER